MAIFDFKIKNGILEKYRGRDANVIIPEGVTELAPEAFKNCKSMKTVSFPSSLHIIGRYTFEGCVSLTELTVPEDVCFLLEGAFKNCTSLRSVKLYCNVNMIDYNAFSGCTSLKSVEIHNNIFSIKVGAFSGCTSLESINIPEAVWEIAGFAFSGCSSLQSVILPDSVKKISDYAFHNCANATVSVPEGATVADNAFERCKEVIYRKVGERIADLPTRSEEKMQDEKAFPAQEGGPLAVDEVSEKTTEEHAPVEKMQNAELGFPLRGSSCVAGDEVVLGIQNAELSTPHPSASPPPSPPIKGEGSSRMQNEKAPAEQPIVEKKPSPSPEATDLPEGEAKAEERYVFISYSTKNQEYAEATLHLVKSEGIAAWMAPYDIPAGSKYAHVINNAIKKCACVLLLLSEESQASEWVEKEVERAINYRKTIISMHLDESQLNDGFSFYLGNQQIVPVRSVNREDSNLQKILDALKFFVK